MGRSLTLLSLFLVLAFCADVSAQECYTLGLCTLDGKQVRSEIVPQTELAKCEDYRKTATETVPGLILAKDEALKAANKCEGTLSAYGDRLSETVQEIDRLNRRLRKSESANTRNFWLGFGTGVTGAVIAGVVYVLVFVK